MWCNTLNHGASYFPVLPPPQMHHLPSLSAEWDTVPPGSLPGLRLGLVGEWRSGEEREDEDSFPAPLSFAMLLREAALLQTRAMLCGTSSHSNNPSVQNVNSFLFANLWPPQPLLLVLLTLPILLLLDGFL